MTFCGSLASSLEIRRSRYGPVGWTPSRTRTPPGRGRRHRCWPVATASIEAWDIVIGRAAAGNSFQPIVLSGLRGVGKTVLLLEFRAHARGAGWPIELFEARPGGDLRAQVAEALPPMIRTVNRRWRNQERAKMVGRIAASFARAVQARMVHGGFRFEVEPEPGVADSGDLETDLTELLVALGEGAQSEGVGASLLIDELHEVPPLQLSALVGAAHRVNQESLPVVIGGAGLPPVGRVLSEARSYAERLFSIRPVGPLSPDGHPSGVRGAGRRSRGDVRAGCAGPARRGVERLSVLHPDVRQARVGHGRRLADRRRRRGVGHPEGEP